MNILQKKLVKIGWNIKGIHKKNLQKKITRGSHYVAHLSFCFEETLYRPFIGASYQISVHLATHDSEEDFLEIDQAETRVV